MDDLSRLPHIILTDTAHTEIYTSPGSGRGSFEPPRRDRQSHGRRLIEKIRRIREESAATIEQQKALGIPAGIIIEFEIDQGFSLQIQSLEYTRSGIELLNMREVDERIYATVFVPDGKLSFFIKRFEAYINEEGKSGKPKYQNLVTSIADINRAVIKALWTDDENEFPVDDQVIWWEVWLRAGDEKQLILEKFDNIIKPAKQGIIKNFWLIGGGNNQAV